MDVSDINPFVEIFIQPSYGLNKCWIVSKLMIGFESAEIYAARSPTGLPGSWEDINEDPYVAGAIIEDDLQYFHSDFTPTHYRLVAVLEGVSYISPVAATYGRLNHKEFVQLRHMLKMELRRMTHEGGMEMLHITPRRSGPVTSGNFDPNTLQLVNTKIEGDNGISLDGNIAPYGYYPAVKTWVQKTSASARVDNVEKLKLRLLPFPQPLANDILVHRPTDQRFVVTAPVSAFLHKGFAPLAFETDAELLPRTDPRYRLTLL